MFELARNFWIFLRSLIQETDWFLLGSALLISGAGLVTMASFVGRVGGVGAVAGAGGGAVVSQSFFGPFFDKQLIWILISVIVYFVCSRIDFRFMRRTGVIMALYAAVCGLLLLLFGLGHISNGAKSWFSLGLFSFQPTDLAKIVLILLLAKYFSRRHVAIANFRHILISGAYALMLFLLIALQPDFGSAVVVFIVWFGMVMVSGISKKHLFAVFSVGLIVSVLLWNFAFHEYQKQRIMTFLYPLQDIKGAGYNAYQSMVAVGSGKLLGKGIGYGTQSKLLFLPEYQTDFIFAAFAEEWGFIGVTILVGLFGVLLWRIILKANSGASNFETLFGLGTAILFMAHLVINIGMNVGLLPVTGITVPFMSYGGSHLLVEFAALGVLTSMAKYARVANKEIAKNEILGIHLVSGTEQANYK